MEQPKNLLSFDGVSAIAFNKDFTMCVASHRDKNLYIYKVDGIHESSKWELKYTLKSVSIFNLHQIKLAFYVYIRSRLEC